MSCYCIKAQVAYSVIDLTEFMKIIIGVTIDPLLSFERHISRVFSTCAQHTKALRDIRSFLDLKTAK